MGRHGGHRTDRRCVGIEATHDTKPYEYGDPFNLDLQQSVMNSVRRQGKGTPIRMQPQDFEIFQNENLNQCSTVLMLDQSRSMGLNGCFEAAKKVALALHSLIKSQYPRDHLYIIGFSDLAHELRHEDIPTVTWGSYSPGTNMQHALIIARRLLGKQRYGQRQVLMITDGEPTAHLELGVPYFHYPPSWRTIEQTLLEVKRCTKEGIVINTFMMEQDPYLMRFVQEVTRINQGRAFFSSPRHLASTLSRTILTTSGDGALPDCQRLLLPCGVAVALCGTVVFARLCRKRSISCAQASPWVKKTWCLESS
jgi:uncharacterized protein with von Willebrand factor type A (vWA) domain